jgi:hypothetical protein
VVAATDARTRVRAAEGTVDEVVVVDVVGGAAVDEVQAVTATATTRRRPTDVRRI